MEGTTNLALSGGLLSGEQAGGMAALASSGEKATLKLMLVAKGVHEKMKFLRVKGAGEYYYKEDGSPIYRRLSDETLMTTVRDQWWGTLGPFNPKNIKDTMEMVKITTEDETEAINSNNIMVCDGLFWRKKDGELVEQPDGPTFYQLFDTDFPDRHTVKVTPFSPEQRQRLLDRYEQEKTKLSRGIFECQYDFINVWANNDPDIAVDILKMTAACFLDKKPLGSGILVGLKRNGKSTYVDMLHTMFGNRNTSRVQLSQLGDPHFTHALRFTLMNAPDEEEEEAVKYAGQFKTMADHGVLTLSVMRSNTPVRVPCDFMSFFPMNHTPQWKGTGASACVARSLIMPFDNDLSQYDKASKNFCEETFTADMFCELLGTVFAYAWYFSRHELAFSQRMSDEQAMIQEDLDSAVTYQKEFEYFFDGYGSMAVIFEDYRLWCAARGATPSSKDRFKFVFRSYLRTKAYQKDGIVNVYRKRGERTLHKDPMLDSTFRPGIGNVSNLHKTNLSMVERLQNKYGDTISEIEGKKRGRKGKQYELGETDTEQQIDW